MVDKPDMSDSKPDATAAKSADAEPVTRAELAELRELTTSLLQTVGTLRTEDARAREFRGLIEDVRAAARPSRRPDRSRRTGKLDAAADPAAVFHPTAACSRSS